MDMPIFSGENYIVQKKKRKRCIVGQRPKNFCIILGGKVSINFFLPFILNETPYLGYVVNLLNECSYLETRK